MSLRAIRILVADDQQDVAQTLTEPLRTADASVQFARNGQEALQIITAGGIDLLIADMKMPPDDWGGLWLLAQLEQAGMALPTLVLSGEGQYQQVVEALRLGARDWLAKEQADSELVPRCKALIDSALRAAIESMATVGPSPLAFGYARYQQALGTDRQYDEGLRRIEEAVRFVALVGLAAVGPSRTSDRKIRPEMFVRPSFGTWLEVFLDLVSVCEDSPIFSSLSRSLMPESDKTLRRIVKLRNDVHHGRGAGSSSDHELVARTTSIIAHRLMVIPLSVGTNAQMSLVKGALEIDYKQHRGVVPPRAARFSVADNQLLRSPDPYLFSGIASPLCMSPWLSTFQNDAPTPPSIGIFDGVRAKNLKRPLADDLLLYVDLGLNDACRCRSKSEQVIPVEK